MPRGKKTQKRKSQPSSGSGSQKKKKKKVEPFVPDDLSIPIPIGGGHKLWSEWRGASITQVMSVSVLHRRLVAPPPPEGEHKWEYYIHYAGLDNRHDRWVSHSALKFSGPSTVKKEGAAGHEHHEGMVRNIEQIQIGKHVMDTWYFSPFPVEYSKYKKLHFCEFCLSYFGHEAELHRHSKKCTLTHPPGKEIYRSKETNIDVAMFEVDGKKEVVYTQNLCYIARLFLKSKNLESDTHPFLFYILCEVTPRGCVMVGYFSKEKMSENNLSCICTLPCHQRKGFGKFLISMSYELSILEGKTGTPEGPLSDLGKRAYFSYWKAKLVDLLAPMAGKEEVSIEDISRRTGMIHKDIKETLEKLDMVKRERGVGFHICIPESLVQARVAKKKKLRECKDRVYVQPCDPKKIRYSPFHAYESAFGKKPYPNFGIE